MLRSELKIMLYCWFNPRTASLNPRTVIVPVKTGVGYNNERSNSNQSTSGPCVHAILIAYSCFVR